MLKKKAFSHGFLMMLVIVLLLVGSTTLLVAVPLGASNTPDHINLSWASDPRTTQTISWRTDVSIVAGQVQYAPATAANEFSKHSIIIDAEVVSMSTQLGDVHIHSVTLIGLKPGTRYCYRVGDGLHWSEPRVFVTSGVKLDGFKFLVFGDSQSTNYDSWRATLHHAYQSNPEAVFFTNVGDLVDVGQDYAQWNAWFDAARDIIDVIPAMPVTGNHETYTPTGHFSMPVLFTTQFKLPPNGPEGLKGEVYSFDYGDVHFIVLDSQAGEEASFLPSVLEKQKVWLERDLGATDKKWKIVFIHRPPYNNKLVGANNSIRDAFMPILEKYQTDVVFTGHDHVYARTYPLQHGVVVDSPQKGIIYVATGRSGTKTYRDTLSKEWNQFFYNPIDEPNYLVVEVKGNILLVKAFKQTGVLIDEWTINKEM